MNINNKPATLISLQNDPQGYWIYYDYCLINNFADEYFETSLVSPVITRHVSSTRRVSWNNLRCASGFDGGRFRMRSSVNDTYSTYIGRVG